MEGRGPAHAQCAVEGAGSDGGQVQEAAEPSSDFTSQQASAGPPPSERTRSRLALRPGHSLRGGYAVAVTMAARGLAQAAW